MRVRENAYPPAPTAISDRLFAHTKRRQTIRSTGARLPLNAGALVDVKEPAELARHIDAGAREQRSLLSAVAALGRSLYSLLSPLFLLACVLALSARFGPLALSRARPLSLVCLSRRLVTLAGVTLPLVGVCDRRIGERAASIDNRPSLSRASVCRRVCVPLHATRDCKHPPPLLLPLCFCSRALRTHTRLVPYSALV